MQLLKLKQLFQPTTSSLFECSLVNYKTLEKTSYQNISGSPRVIPKLISKKNTTAIKRLKKKSLSHYLDLIQLLTLELNSGSVVKGFEHASQTAKLLSDPHTLAGGAIALDNSSNVHSVSASFQHPENGLVRAITAVVALNPLSLSLNNLHTLNLKTGDCVLYKTPKNNTQKLDITLKSNDTESTAVIHHYYQKPSQS